MICVPFILTLCLAVAFTPHFVHAQETGGAAKVVTAADDKDCRRPANDAELRYWLETMLWDFRYTPAEASSATGLSSHELTDALKRFGIRGGNRPRPAAETLLKVRPYPGGRHPRIGFLDGAVRPQRETKFGVFCPWDPSSYVVVDVPEAVFCNLGLIYLAHTHVPTIWTKRGIELAQLEWTRGKDGRLASERQLPNGIKFGVNVDPSEQAVVMEFWLTNGSAELVSNLRMQHCVLLKGADGFQQRTHDNKLFSGIYACCHSPDRKRWIITAWSPLDRTWENDRCPCLHSDPKLPDCPPGETKRAKGWLSFYEGTNIADELGRIESTRWHEQD